jgi:hypothetical protein
MLNKNFIRFGGGGDTFVTPATLVVLILASLLILALPRKYQLGPFFLGSFFIPISQTINLASIHFMAYRILLTVLWLGILWKGPSLRGLRLNAIDSLFVLWGISAAVTFSLLWLDVGALVNRIAFIYDAFGIYFAMRLFHRSEEDVRRTVTIFSVGCVIISIGMLVEHFTRFNLFSIVGAANDLDSMSDGRVRSKGPFAHPIIAGTCAAALMPLFLGLWWQGKARLAAVAGAVAATVMTVTSTSSTAALAYAAGIGALFMWPLRKYLRVFRWSVAIILITLHLSMKAPVWALIGHIDLMGGSSSYHRYELINQTILHFWDWYLVGEKTTYQWGFNLWDTANTYVETAVTGGLSTLVLFVSIIVCCFRKLGRARKKARNRERAKLNWSLGAALFSSAVGFIGITYYDQASVIWYSLVALICTAATLAAGAATKTKPSQEVVGVQTRNLWSVVGETPYPADVAKGDSIIGIGNSY